MERIAEGDMPPQWGRFRDLFDKLASEAAAEGISVVFALLYDDRLAGAETFTFGHYAAGPVLAAGMVQRAGDVLRDRRHYESLP